MPHYSVVYCTYNHSNSARLRLSLFILLWSSILALMVIIPVTRTTRGEDIAATGILVVILLVLSLLVSICSFCRSSTAKAAVPL